MSSQHEERLTEFGVPADAVRGIVAETLSENMRAAAAINASPAGQWLQANQQQLGAFLQARPEVAATVSKLAEADAIAALDYARLKMGEPARGGGTTYLPMGAPVRHDLPGAQPGAAPWMASSGDIEAARAEFHRTGSREAANRYGHARLRPLLEAQFRQAGQSLGPEPW